jgi:hypothetical protein
MPRRVVEYFINRELGGMLKKSVVSFLAVDCLLAEVSLTTILSV